LIELMFTLTLLAILLTLGLPSLAMWVKNSQVRTVTEALQNGLRTAQAEALRRNRTVVLSFTNGTPSANATAVAGGKNWSLQSLPQTGETTGEYIQGGQLTDIASSVAITAIPTSTSAVCFNSNGRLIANSGAGCALPTGGSSTYQFDIAQATDDPSLRSLRVLLQVGGQMRTCDPKRPVLSAATPDGCPPT
jgi:type IV fimbrial biogenesis protein FimT